MKQIEDQRRRAKGGGMSASRGRSAANAAFATILGIGLMMPTTALADEPEQVVDEPITAASSEEDQAAGVGVESEAAQSGISSDASVSDGATSASESDGAAEPMLLAEGDASGYDITKVDSVDDLDSGINAETGVHEYGTNIDKAWVYTCPDAGASDYGVKISFDERTFIENNYDYVYVYAGTYDPDSNDNVCVAELTGKVAEGDFGDVYVVGTDTFTLRMVCDSSNGSPSSTEVYWGFKVSAVQALQANDLSVVGSLEPIQSQLISDANDEGFLEPAPVVMYGWGDQARELVAGQDYEVSYANNNEVGEATATVTGINKYEGSLSYNFRIVEHRDAPIVFEDEATARWSGDETISFGGSVSDAGEAGYYADAVVEKVVVGNTEYTGSALENVSVSADGSVTIPAAWLG